VISLNNVVFAGARGPHERGDAAAARGDVQSVENRAAADAVTHIADLNNGIAGLRRRSVRTGILRFGHSKAAKNSKRQPAPAF
jgi:hypothetical protein